MLKELAQYIVGLSKPELVDINGMLFSDRKLERYDYKEPDALHFKSITGFLEYIKTDCDSTYAESFIHIKNYDRIEFLSPLNDDNEREIYAICEPDKINIMFNKFIEREQFNIMLQTGFVENNDLSDILRYIGNMSDKAVRTVGDNGISQEITIKSSTQGLIDVFIPNPVILKPYRTFTEIEPVESKFVFRMQEGGYCGLFEADGGAWKINTMHALEEYISDVLESLEIDIKVFA
jgi:hypothetical protein